MIKVVVLSYNRYALLKKTVESIHNTGLDFSLTILDASTDSTTIEYVKQFGNTVFLPKSNVGQAMNYAADLIKDSGMQYGLISADDYLYNAYWLEVLLNFWKNANSEIKLTSCNFEPDYSWNKVYAMYAYGNHQYAFLRESLPGSNWSFRTADLNLIFPVAEKTGGEDLETCTKLRSQKYHLASLDLTDHIGEKVSAWGNKSFNLANKLTRLEVLQKFNYDS